MKHLYMVNRFSLGNKTDAVIRALEKASAECGRDYEICDNHGPMQAKRLTQNCHDENCAITAIGGDGSIHLILNDMVGTGSVLSFVPYGTGNDFYRTCRETLSDGILEADLIRVNNRYSINAVCFGIDADIANDDSFIHSRVIPKPLRYHTSVFYHFLTWKKGRPLTIECEGQTFEKAFTTVVAANARYYGGGYKICPDSVIDDGLMDVCIVEQLGKVNMARTILSMKNAGHLQNPSLQMLRTKKLVVSSRHPLQANLDGESLTSNRFELELIPKGVRLEYDSKFIELFNKAL